MKIALLPRDGFSGAAGIKPARRRTMRRVAAFRRAEDGAMVIYSLFLLMIMLIVAGIGVDFMHYEMSRTRLQNTLDRAVLAAADLQQPLDPASVVQDYLDKADVDAVLTGSPTVTSALNERSVVANATLDVPTQFIRLLGFNSLVAPATAGAEEKVEGVEIALVLDISGSMNRSNRLVNLKPAAREFVDTVTSFVNAGDITISIIPYNTQVNAGAALLSHYNVSNEHSFSNCVNFDAADFNSAALSTAQPLERTGHFSVWYDEQGGWPAQNDNLSVPTCPNWAGTEMMVMNGDATTLKNKIDSLTANGNTSIDIGMKWASTMLDPGTRPVITQMIADGDVDPANAGRPRNYDEPGVTKVIVVMTDGQNTTQYRLPAWARSGASDVYFHSTSAGPIADRYSIYDAGANAFFWVSDGNMHPSPYGDSDDDPANGLGAAVQLSYPELTAMNSMPAIAEHIYKPKDGNGQAWNDWYDAFVNNPGNVVASIKDARLQSMCTAAKDNGVFIYAIGFEATANGNVQMENCASTPSHFFDVDGTDITSAFQAIATSIAQLRLTQ